MSRFTEAQQAAIDARGQNYIVSAGAGSGKTTVLTERVLSLLNSGLKIERMLILTFTVNAAFNMKARIKAKMLSDPKLADQVKHVDGADIETFDSFNQKIVRKYRLDLGLSADFSIVDSSYLEVVKTKILDAVLTEKYRSRDAGFIALLDTYTLKTDEPVRNLIRLIDSALSNSADPDAAWRQAADHCSDAGLISRVYGELLREAKETVREFDRALLQCPLTSDEGLCYLENYRKLLQELETKTEFDSFKTAFGLLKFPRLPSKCPESEKEAIKEVRDSYNGRLKKLAKIIAEADYGVIFESQRVDKLTVLDLVREYRKRLAAYKSVNECYEFSDIARLALELLTNRPEIRREVRASYDEIMVDEYQDNSDLQEAVIDLLANSNLFTVGDVKQSIYRFRNANPTLFMNRYERYKQKDGGSAIDMNENFRSSPAVIDDVNYIFRRLMTVGFGGADYERDHLILAANPVYREKPSSKNRLLTYTVEPGVDKAEQEAELIARDIIFRLNREIGADGQKLSCSDFAVILDRGTDFDTYVDVFTRCGLPLVVDKDQDARHLVVLDIVKNLCGLFLALSNRENNKSLFKRSLVSVSRSFLFTTSDNIILTAFETQEFSTIPAFVRMREFIDEYADQDMTLYEFFLNLLEQFEVMAKLETIADVRDNLAVLLAYAETVKSLSGLGLDVAAFYDYLTYLKKEDIRVQVKINSNFKDAVILTNIHKSKGLEYNYCYYAGLYKKYNALDLNNPFKFSTETGLILPLYASARDEIDPFDYSYKKRERLADRGEKVRLLYVALTRAKYAMTFVAPSERKKPASLTDSDSFAGLLEQVRYFERLEPVSTRASEILKCLPPLNPAVDFGFSYKQLEPESFSRPDRSRASKKAVGADMHTLEFGTRVHELAESLDLKTPDYDAIADPRLRSIAVRLVSAMQKLGAGEARIYHEYQYYDTEHDSIASVDLLLVFPAKVIIVDFKLKNLTDDAYRRQLEFYAAGIGRLFGLSVETYLYSLLDGEIESVAVVSRATERII